MFVYENNFVVYNKVIRNDDNNKKQHNKRSDYDLFVQIIIFEDMTLFF